MWYDEVFLDIHQILRAHITQFRKLGHERLADLCGNDGCGMGMCILAKSSLLRLGGNNIVWRARNEEAKMQPRQLKTTFANCAGKMCPRTYSPEPTHQFNKLPNLKSFRNLFGSDFRWVGCCGCGWRQVCLQKLAKKVRTQKSKLKYCVKLYYHIQNPKLQGLIEFTTILRL